jgi:hypothetical protein
MAVNAVVYKRPHEVAVEEVDEPAIERIDAGGVTARVPVL